MLTMSIGGAAGVMLQWTPRSEARAQAGSDRALTLVSIAEFSDAGVRQGVKDLPKIVKSEGEWRRLLSPLAFEIARHESTERPFTGATWNIHDKGLYRCICCDTALFSSMTKFDSGTGWPSFWAPLDRRNLQEHRDASFGMVRTAVSCRRCDAHLGHVFDDGPRPTGLRYCMNSAAMRFVTPEGRHP
jgi:peptide-methionine (R)-S-oxide reductase